MFVLQPHLNAVSKLRPTSVYLSRFILPHPTNHQFWNDGPRRHGHDTRTGQALYKISRGGRSSTFYVVRLLLEDRYCGLPPRTRVVNVCALPQCVNLSHWRVTFPVPEHRLHPLLGDCWELVVAYNDETVQRAACVNISDRDCIHVVDAIPGRALSARCGVLIDSQHAVVVTQLPTCEGCRR